jgi:hypothetical protein
MADEFDLGKLVEIDPDVPPRELRQPAAPRRVRPAKPRKPPLEDRLREAFGLVGIGIVAVNEYDGTVFLAGSDKLAKSLADVAVVNESVRRVLEAALTGGIYGALAMAVSAIALPIAANHGLVPESVAEPICTVFGVETPRASKPDRNGADDGGEPAVRPLASIPGR